jgi:ParB-like chromosome segregation protein Spo0J
VQERVQRGVGARPGVRGVHPPPPHPEKRVADRPSPGNGRFAPVDRVERWPLARLTPYARNPRLHSAEQVDQIAASMQEFGQAQIIVVDEQGEIIAGHGRVSAAEQLGWKDLMVGIAIGWSEEQRKAYRIADNQIGLTSRWDDVLLRMEFNELKLKDFDTALLGFDEGYLSSLMLNIERGKMDPDHEWTGMPDFEKMGGVPFKIVRVLFKDQKAVDAFARLIKQEISDAKSSWLWYPAVKKQNLAEKKFIVEK